MEDVLNRTPKWIVGLVGVGLIMALTLLATPPRTWCDDQLDQFKVLNKAFFQPQGAKVAKVPAIDMLEQCKVDNGPGGCFDWFLNVRKFVESLERLPKECRAKVSQDEAVKGWLMRAVTLFVQIAWGDGRASTYSVRKQGWLDAADFRLYCRSKNVVESLYGADHWAQFRESMLVQLPESADLSREARWTRSLFSQSCDAN